MMIRNDPWLKVTMILVSPFVFVWVILWRLWLTVEDLPYLLYIDLKLNYKSLIDTLKDRE